MSHDLHSRLPGHVPEAILHHGCAECEERAAAGLEGLLQLDETTFARLWDRMVRREFNGGVETNDTEAQALRTCYYLYVLLERCFDVPAEVLRDGGPGAVGSAFRVAGRRDG